MIINKPYIDGSYTYITKGYIDIVKMSLAYLANTGLSNVNIKNDLISLNHYILIIQEFAKYYASMIDDATLTTITYLTADDDDGEESYLQSSDLLYLVSTRSDYTGDYSESTDDNIIDKYIRTSTILIEDINVDTNISSTGFVLNHVRGLDIEGVLQDSILDELGSIDYNKASSFVNAVKNSNEIIFKYANTRYTNKVLNLSAPEYTVSFIVRDIYGNAISGATINMLSFDEFYTNDSGIASVDAISGVYTYTISYDGNTDVEGSVKVIDDDVIVSIEMIHT